MRVVLVALATALAACGAQAPPPYRSGTPASVPRIVQRSFDRSHTLTADAVAVRLSVPAGVTRASLVVRGSGTRAVLAGPTTVALSGGEAAVEVPLTDAGRRAIASCASAPATVEVRRPGGATAQRTTLAPDDGGPPCGRFFGARAPWNAALAADAPLDPSSAARVQVLEQEVAREVAARFGPDVNAGDYSTRVYTVAGDARRVPVALAPHKAALGGPFRSVPLPSDARPAAGTDRHLVLWQPATDTMWEFFGLERRDDGWHAEWGGRIVGVSRSDGVFRSRRGVHYGATATGLALAGGLITPGDLRRGRIDHALAVAIPKALAGRYALPAQRTDGVNPAPDAIPEGARFRLDPDVDVAALDLPPLGRMIAEALQRYGMIVRDQSAVVTFYAQIPTADEPAELGRAKEGRFSAQILAALPWDRMQLLRMDLRPVDG